MPEMVKTEELKGTENGSLLQNIILVLIGSTFPDSIYQQEMDSIFLQNFNL